MKYQFSDPSANENDQKCIKMKEKHVNMKENERKSYQNQRKHDLKMKENHIKIKENERTWTGGRGGRIQSGQSGQLHFIK